MRKRGWSSVNADPTKRLADLESQGRHRVICLLLFVRDHALVAQPFNAAKGETSGEPTLRGGSSRSLFPSRCSISGRRTSTLGTTFPEMAASPAWVIEELMDNVRRAKQAIRVTNTKGEPTVDYRWDGSVTSR